MAEYELTITVRLYQEGEVWRAEGEKIPLFLGGPTFSELIGFVVSGVEELAQWIVASKPSEVSIESYCESMGIDCRRIDTVDGLGLAKLELEQVIDDASRQLTATHRLASPEPVAA